MLPIFCPCHKQLHSSKQSRNIHFHAASDSYLHCKAFFFTLQAIRNSLTLLPILEFFSLLQDIKTYPNLLSVSVRKSLVSFVRVMGQYYCVQVNCLCAVQWTKLLSISILPQWIPGIFPWTLTWPCWVGIGYWLYSAAVLRNKIEKYVTSCWLFLLHCAMFLCFYSVMASTEQ